MTKIVKNVTEEVTEINWDLIPTGSSFTGTINGDIVEGKIYKRSNKIWLCQDKKDGDVCYNRLGYKYSWFISTGSSSKLLSNSAIIHSITVVDDFELSIVIKGYEGKVENGYIQFGCVQLKTGDAIELVRRIESPILTREDNIVIIGGDDCDIDGHDIDNKLIIEAVSKLIKN